QPRRRRSADQKCVEDRYRHHWPRVFLKRLLVTPDNARPDPVRGKGRAFPLTPRVGKVSSMPAADTTRARRSTRLLPTAVFWAGVALAPLAVLLFLVSTGAFAMQIAAVLAVVALALMGVALWLNRDGDSARAEVEEVVFEELDAMRGEVRDDIA